MPLKECYHCSSHERKIFFFIMKKKIDQVDKQPETGKHVGRNVERGTRPETIVVS